VTDASVAGALSLYKDAFTEAFRPPWQVARVLGRIVACRSGALGTHVCECPECGTRHEEPNSCRDRHCPRCQKANRAEWLEDRRRELLGATYYHVVFTLPDCLNRLALSRMREVYKALFHAAWGTIDAFGRGAGMRLGATCVLHTWGAAMSLHPHLHCIVPGGGMDLETGRWKQLPVRVRENGGQPFLFPVAAMSSKFRGLYVATLRKLGVEPPKDVADACFARDWVVYCKSPSCGPEATLEYLSRYVYRVAITDSRVLSVSDGGVEFAYKDRRDNRSKTMTLDGVEFVRRFSMHILPSGFFKVRHYGILSPACRKILKEMQLQSGSDVVYNGGRRKEGKRPPRTRVCMVCGCMVHMSIRWRPPYGARAPDFPPPATAP